ncbi:zinc finger protein GLIS2 homolog [Eupeodes corollae]|uniref:zinc finger protein GLIS2 homolog n=1 Tax=Eupeodes corollae TaxID=290404 RepID=UPI0024923037|nr:zinc finger protein GLIS2 homolog [Eupeodes corollae]
MKVRRVARASNARVPNQLSLSFSPKVGSLAYTPPYTYGYDFRGPSLMSEDEIAAHHYMRFPTPPVTPPRESTDISRVSLSPPTYQHAIGSTVHSSSRKKSVIMKVSLDNQITEVNTATVVKEKDHDSSACENELICCWTDCGRIFESLELLAAHVTQIHAIASLDGLYYCKWEGCSRTSKGFNARYKMLVHVRTHTKEKPHQCHLCDKSFSRAENLKIHIRSHSGEKPYVCSFEGCRKAYSNSSDRFKHTRTHSMEKPYVCKVVGCQKRYTDPSSLRKHVKTFKHSEQILREEPKPMITVSDDSYSPLKTNERYMLEESYEDQLYISSETSPRSECYSRFPKSFDLKYDSYYYGPHVPTDPYWLTASTHSHKFVLPMEPMDMDSPLDLSTNRR